MRRGLIFLAAFLGTVVFLWVGWGIFSSLSTKKENEETDTNIAKAIGSEPKEKFNDTLPKDVPLSLPGLIKNSNIPIGSRSGVVIEADTGKVILEQNAFATFPLASLTKLMSAMVALDHRVNLEESVSISAEDYKIGGNLRIVPNSETVKVRDLLYASITGSANNAAIALAKKTGLSDKDFVEEMNRKAIELKLDSLHFADTSGLSPENTGSAYDISRLAGYVFTKYPIIFDAASKSTYKIVTQNTHREHIIKNPNTLFESCPEEFVVSKTGYLDEALYNLVLGRKSKKDNKLIIGVTLGHPSKGGGERETLSLLDDADAGRVAGASAEAVE